MSDDFVPPKPTPWLRSTLVKLSPRILPLLGISGVEYDEADLAKLREIAPYTAMFTPNHPTLSEPVVMFHLSGTLEQPFYFVTAREVFKQAFGVYGWVIQHVGGYSLERGTVDRVSFRLTRELLGQKGNKVVIFPEGEVHLQNGTLLPFQSGVFQIAFWAVEDMRKAGRTDEPFYIVPVACRYRFQRDVTEQLQGALERLEKHMGATPQAGDDIYRRLRRVSLAMLHSLEREYRLTPAKSENELDDDLTDRMDAVKEAILVRVAAAAGVATPKGATLIDRMRGLYFQVAQMAREEPDAPTPYDLDLSYQRRERARPLIADLDRLSNWIAAYDGYVRADPTQERLADTLIRMEKECFGKSLITEPRQYRVHVGDPVNVAERWPDYEKNKRATVTEVTRQVEAEVARLLGATPVPENLFA
jgi:hypothetical protein